MILPLHARRRHGQSDEMEELTWRFCAHGRAAPRTTAMTRGNLFLFPKQAPWFTISAVLGILQILKKFESKYSANSRMAIHVITYKFQTIERAQLCDKHLPTCSHEMNSRFFQLVHGALSVVCQKSSTGSPSKPDRTHEPECKHVTRRVKENTLHSPALWIAGGATTVKSVQ